MKAVKRVDFLGQISVPGPRQRHFHNFIPAEWPKWTVQVEGGSVLIGGEGRLLEIPRSSCVVEWIVSDDLGAAKGKDKK